MRKFYLAMSLVMLGSVAGATDSARAAEQPEKTVIDASDLNTRYQVRGPLGAPLGEVVTIIGTRVQNQMKDQTDVLEVTTVDGKRLASPVTIRYQTLSWTRVAKLEMNGQYELRGYQDGGFTGVPAQAMEATGLVQTRRYGFAVHLVVLKAWKRSTAAERSDGR